ncbi:hypothetical protein PG999_012216 [Apiospora kogelbergensis]|uniref:F-box domain-containing protein n=1 Tax=Apiospora kogelbergensis TaxID=1337665 RepID=A0AAW0QGZ7_9PEZI
MCQTTTVSLLESLPDDILLHFQSFCHSLVDLYAFIRASPDLYRVFRTAKRTILYRIARRDVGPVIRDYIALASLSLHPLNVDNHDIDVARFLGRYRRLLANEELAVHTHTMCSVEIIRAKRTVQFFVDMYARSRIPVLGLQVPEAGTPLTALEFQRLSQVFVRYQIFTILFPRHSWHVRQMGNRSVFAALFKPWEMEQLSTAHGFLLSVSFIQRLGDNFAEHADFRGGWEKEADNFEDLNHFQRGIEAVDGADKEVTIDLHFGPDSIRYECYWAMIRSSHLYPVHHSLPLHRPEKIAMVQTQHLLRSNEAVRPGLSAGPSVVSPPFGWVDAMGGLDCLRWGAALLPCRCDGIVASDCSDLWKDFRRWRSLGFLFWDKERVEHLKGHYRWYKSDWITEACRNTIVH